jgi:hypothetical protein
MPQLGSWLQEEMRKVKQYAERAERTDSDISGGEHAARLTPTRKNKYKQQVYCETTATGALESSVMPHRPGSCAEGDHATAAGAGSKADEC